MSELQLISVDAGYGRTPVLKNIDFEVGPGELVAVIGRNGVGKTTLLKTAVRITTVYRGKVVLDGKDVTHGRPHSIARAGVQFVPDDRGVFPHLTVEENLRLGVLAANGRPQERDWVLDLFPVLRERMGQMGGSLSGGERQMLALARALIAKPRILLLDEFSEGVQPNLVEKLAVVLKEIVGLGVGIGLVEQNVRLALELCNRAVIVEKGTIVDSGSAADFLNNEERIKKHLVV